jgi:hypothetical protein
LFSNINSPDFAPGIVPSIDAIRKQVNQIRQLVTDRILDHIDSNILAKNWASEFKDAEKVQERVPLVVQLFRERQEALRENEER